MSDTQPRTGTCPLGLPVFFKYENSWQVEGQCSSMQVDGASYGGSLESSYEYSARHPPEIVNLLGIFMGNGENLGC